MDLTTSTMAFRVNIDHFPRMALADMIFSFVFESHPKLQIGVIEHEVTWVTHFLERMDYLDTQRTASSRRGPTQVQERRTPQPILVR